MKDGTEKKAIVPNNSEFISFISRKIEEGSEVEIEVVGNFDLSSLPSLIIMVFYVFFMFFIRKQTGSGKFNIKKANKDKVTFDDIAGMEEMKEQIEDIIEYLKKPNKYSRAGARMPKGILLSGEPGNGKTLLAKAISGEAGVPFFQVNGSSFDERLVGVGAARVRELFNKAKKEAPAIIFIDEIDSIGKSRYSETTYNEQTLSQLLAEMDGFDSNDNIIVIAATNHPEVLDKAITSPGRFDKNIYIPSPDIRSRELILKLHAKNKKVSEEVSIKNIARKTVGFSGADLENILNEAAIYSVRTNRGVITNDIIEECIARKLVGLKRYSVMSQYEKHITAIHEAGHAIVSFIVRPDVRNFCISIVPRGMAGGYNFFDESKNIYLQKKNLLNQIKVLYGGRVAEKTIIGECSGGAANDFEKDCQIALKMTTKYGMSSFFLVKVENEQKYNREIESRAIEEINNICEQMYKETERIVIKYRLQIEKLASILEEKEYLTQKEISEFMSANFNL